LPSNHNLPPIGVLDSGLGGLTFVSQLYQKAPSVSVAYFADTAYLPYGNLAPAQIQQRVLTIAQFFLQQGVQLLVLPCHTATASLASYELPIFTIDLLAPSTTAIGTIASTQIALLATPSMLQTGRYASHLQQHFPSSRFFPLPCPNLASLIEAHTPLPILEAEITKLIKTLPSEIDTLFLGCTHYSLIIDLFQKLYPHFLIVDPILNLTNLVLSHINPRSSNSSGLLSLFTSKDPRDLQTKIQHITLPLPPSKVYFRRDF
jgi:glutamate racemase